MKKFYSGFGTGVAALIILLCPGTLVFGSEAYYSTYGDYNPTLGYEPGYFSSSESSGTYVSFSRPVGDILSIGSGKSYSTAYGYADARNLKLGVSTWAISLEGNTTFTDAFLKTGVSNRFTVSPGTSGLSIGDTTTLSLSICLDGLLIGKARSWPGFGFAHADMSAGLSIYDYGISQNYGEGRSTSELASFGAYGMFEASDISKPTWGYSYDSSWEESWGTESNSGDGSFHSNSDDKIAYDEGMYFANGGHSFDTGPLTLTFDAIVGHSLDLDAFLYAYVSANFEGEARSDFGNTFAFDVTPTVDGLLIDWETGPQPVPAPGGLVLFGSGLLSLLGLRRTRVKNDAVAKTDYVA
jgi:hypothetical protein